MRERSLYEAAVIVLVAAAALLATCAATSTCSAAADTADTGPSADDRGHVDVPSAAELDEALPQGGTLTGRELYDRFLKNKRRLRTVFQRGRISSRDPAGNPQETRFWLYWKDYRDQNDDPVDGVSSKSLFKIVGPYEMRHTGYLYIERSDRPDEQFMYSPNRGRTARVSLKGQRVAGTDFSFDDFLVNLDDIEDADYERHPDETLQGVRCYVVEATMKDEAASGYSRSIAYLEQQHYVPLRMRYWDDVGVEVKELTTPNGKIHEFDGAWVPTESSVVDLLEQTSSTMYVEQLEPNPDLDDGVFSISQLEFKP